MYMMFINRPPDKEDDNDVDNDVGVDVEFDIGTRFFKCRCSWRRIDFKKTAIPSGIQRHTVGMGSDESR